MNSAPKLLHKWLIICGAFCLAALRPSACWAATGALPWDQTLVTLQDILVGTVAHAAIALAFIGAGLLHAAGGTTSKLAVSRPQASAVAWRSARSDC